MKLHELQQARMNLVGHYGPGVIVVNGRRLASPCVLAPGFMLEDWISDLSLLSLESLAPVWALQPRILLLGAAAALPVATVKLLRAPLAARQVALEAMDLGAACRTYNVLAQEDRAVVALLFP
ncbi:MAG: MTH938/NDUFAF3 family protein [Steroidobacteraceae bacterium]